MAVQVRHDVRIVFAHPPMADAVVAAKEHTPFKRAEHAAVNEATLVFSLPGDSTREVTIAVIGFWLRPAKPGPEPG